ncbi:HTH domain-containing protein [Butyrivibrio sp. YAB3001]|uniref:HTH domain-containing protein n=1 Tax=Butyrivibrio sp. YAB3001 TaxID=1520812 RepID=UPI0008F61A63|nr:HTH domain-containing protein [Butyrivibrio sp. YAB3001]SFD13047.1 hypothetical protein SAMN02910398_04144 [Butyrivibrio sp. YAB3001]
MREYTAKEIKSLSANPYTFKVTKHKLYFTIEFKEAFWVSYQAGIAPRKILEDLGYDVELFGQKQIDSIVQRIKYEASSGLGFNQGENRSMRAGMAYKKRGSEESSSEEDNSLNTPEQRKIAHLEAEVKYLHQEVDFLKKITKAVNSQKRK